MFKNKFKISICKKIKDPSLYIFIIFFIYLYFLLNNVKLSNTDDMGFWGTRLLDINRTDAFYTDEYTVFGVTSYPPFTTLLEMSFIKMFGTFSQTYSLLAMSSFCFSLLLSFFDNCFGIIKWIITFVIALLSTLMVQRNLSFDHYAFIYNSLYVDWLLGIVLAKGFSLLYKFEDKREYIKIGICATVLSLSKQIGIALALLLIATTYVYLAVKESRIIINKVSLLEFMGFVVGVPTICYGLWKIYIGRYITFSFIGIFKNLISFKTILLLLLLLLLLICVIKNIKNKFLRIITSIICLLIPIIAYLICETSFLNIEDSYYLDITRRFITACFTSSIIEHPFKISYYPITLSVTSILCLIGYYRKENESYYVIPVMYYLGSMAYALGILFSYMFVFGYEGYSLAVFGRYMQTYTYAGMLLILFVLLKKEIEVNKLLIICLACCLLIEPDSLSTIVYKKHRQIYRSDKQIMAIDEYFEYEYNYEPLVIFSQGDVRDWSLFSYLADEKNINITKMQVSKQTSYNDFVDIIKDKKLILIGVYDDDLLVLWKEVTDVELYNTSLYSVDYRNGDIKINLVYTWDEL